MRKTNQNSVSKITMIVLQQYRLSIWFRNKKLLVILK